MSRKFEKGERRKKEGRKDSMSCGGRKAGHGGLTVLMRGGKDLSKL